MKTKRRLSGQLLSLVYAGYRLYSIKRRYTMRTMQQAYISNLWQFNVSLGRLGIMRFVQNSLYR